MVKLKASNCLDIPKLRHWTFHFFTLVQLIPYLIDHPVTGLPSLSVEPN